MQSLCALSTGLLIRVGLSARAIPAMRTKAQTVLEIDHDEGAQAQRIREGGHGMCAVETELRMSGGCTKTFSSLVIQNALLERYPYCFYVTYHGQGQPVERPNLLGSDFIVGNQTSD